MKDAGDFPEDTWNLEMVHADSVETELSKTESQVTNHVSIAVLDSGIEGMSSVRPAGNVNFVEEEDDVAGYMQDMTGHGTAVAGIIRNIATQADIYSVKILDEKNRAPLSRIIRGIYWCIDQNIDILNMSFGTETKSRVMEKAVQAADENGILMIAAAGNGGTEEGVNYPAAFDEVIAVGAVDEMARRCEDSAAGEELELSAPGENIVSEGMFGTSVIGNGTSMAAPHVTGIAAVLWAKDKNRSAAAVRFLLDQSSRNMGDSEKYGNGIPDLSYALEHYDEYMQAFEYGTENIPQNTSEVDVFEEIKEENEAFAVAKWGSAKHKESLGNATDYKNISSWEFELMKRGAVLPDYIRLDPEEIKNDDKYKNKWENNFNQVLRLLRTYNKTDNDNPNLKVMNSQQFFHGNKNYVASIAYLYNVALKIRNGKNVDEAIDNTTYRGRWDNSQKKKAEKAILKLTVRCALDYSEICYTDVENYNTKRGKAAIILGMALHIAGDVYAHHSRVPRRSIKEGAYDLKRKGSEKMAPTKLYSEDFDDWEKVRTKINDKELIMVNLDGKMKDTLKSGETKVALYTDAVSFYGARYEKGAKKAVAYFMENYNSRNSDILSYKAFCYCSQDECRLRGLRFYAENTYKNEYKSGTCDNYSTIDHIVEQSYEKP